MGFGRVDTVRYRRNDARQDRLIGGRISRKDYDEEWYVASNLARILRQPQSALDAPELPEIEDNTPDPPYQITGAGYNDEGYLIVNYPDGTDHLDPQDIRAYQRYCLN